MNQKLSCWLLPFWKKYVLYYIQTQKELTDMINKIPSTAEMKHYSAEEFCADMDAILDE